MGEKFGEGPRRQYFQPYSILILIPLLGRNLFWGAKNVIAVIFQKIILGYGLWIEELRQIQGIVVPNKNYAIDQNTVGDEKVADQELLINENMLITLFVEIVLGVYSNSSKCIQ